MKYSTHNLDEPDLPNPLPSPIKLIVEYWPDGKLLEYAPMVKTTTPESTADSVVKERGWDVLPGFDPKDVWVDGAF
jgi:hypothetical protein